MLRLSFRLQVQEVPGAGGAPGHVVVHVGGRCCREHVRVARDGTLVHTPVHGNDGLLCGGGPQQRRW
jgi:hypothetical protein